MPFPTFLEKLLLNQWYIIIHCNQHECRILVFFFYHCDYLFNQGNSSHTMVYKVCNIVSVLQIFIKWNKLVMSHIGRKRSNFKTQLHFSYIFLVLICTWGGRFVINNTSLNLTKTTTLFMFISKVIWVSEKLRNLPMVPTRKEMELVDSKHKDIELYCVTSKKEYTKQFK